MLNRTYAPEVPRDAEVRRSTSVRGEADVVIGAAAAGLSLAALLVMRVIPSKILSLEDHGCLCTPMYRISPQHLAWALENLVEGRVVNQIKVRKNVKHWARVALDRMLEVQ